MYDVVVVVVVVVVNTLNFDLSFFLTHPVAICGAGSLLPHSRLTSDNHFHISSCRLTITLYRPTANLIDI